MRGCRFAIVLAMCCALMASLCALPTAADAEPATPDPAVAALLLPGLPGYQPVSPSIAAALTPGNLIPKDKLGNHVRQLVVQGRAGLATRAFIKPGTLPSLIVVLLLRTRDPTDASSLAAGVLDEAVAAGGARTRIATPADAVLISDQVSAAGSTGDTIAVRRGRYSAFLSISPSAGSPDLVLAAITQTSLLPEGDHAISSSHHSSGLVMAIAVLLVLGALGAVGLLGVDRLAARRRHEHRPEPSSPAPTWLPPVPPPWAIPPQARLPAGAVMAPERAAPPITTSSAAGPARRPLVAARKVATAPTTTAGPPAAGATATATRPPGATLTAGPPAAGATLTAGPPAAGATLTAGPPPARPPGATTTAGPAGATLTAAGPPPARPPGATTTAGPAGATLTASSDRGRRKDGQIGTGEAAVILGVSVATVRRMVERGELAAQRSGRTVRLNRREVEQLV